MRHRSSSYYYFFKLLSGHYVSDYTVSDPYDNEGVKSYDDMLHQALSEIFRERCSLTSDQIKELLRAGQEHEDQDSIIKLVLEKNPALDRIFPSRDNNKLSLLWIAVLGCYQNSAELLVRSGADVNERCDSQSAAAFAQMKWTVLHLLLQMYPSLWNERFIDLVVDHGADLQAALDSRGESVLHYAVRKRRVQVTKLFLEKGAAVHVTDDCGKTPLLTAACIGQGADELVPLLMQHGADVTVRDTGGHNALHYLASDYLPSAPVEHADLARVLIEKGVSLDDKTTECHFQPLHVAASHGKNELVKVFLDHGADVNARAKHGGTPVFYAATCRNPAVLLSLLKRGANVELKMTDGSTALHRACNCDYVGKEYRKNIKILLSVGADMCVENSAGKTPLATLIPFARLKSRTYRSLRLLLKTLALRKARLMIQRSIELKDERIIEQHPEQWAYYRDCVKHICKTKSMSLTETCTLFDLLTKCPCQIAALLHDVEFETKFWRFDLEVFCATYENVIRRAFNRAKLHHQSILKQEDAINEAVHNILPWEVARKVARYAVGCEECKLKKIVHASKQI